MVIVNVLGHYWNDTKNMLEKWLSLTAAVYVRKCSGALPQYCCGSTRLDSTRLYSLLVLFNWGLYLVPVMIFCTCFGQVPGYWNLTCATDVNSNNWCEQTDDLWLVWEGHHKWQESLVYMRESTLPVRSGQLWKSFGYSKPWIFNYCAPFENTPLRASLICNHECGMRLNQDTHGIR